MVNEYGIVVTTLGILKLRPGFDQETSDETLFGRRVKLLESLDDHWYLVETDYGYRGYIHGMSLLLEENKVEKWSREAKHTVIWNMVDTLKEPRYQAARGTILTRGAIVKKTGREKESWEEIEVPTGEKYWLRGEHLGEEKKTNNLKEEELRESIVNLARKYLGTQYRWGGKSSIGLDCSGLTHLVYLVHGIQIYRDAKIVEGYPIKEIARERLGKGDLLYWPGHVAIYLGDGQYIHSTGQAGGVVINSLNEDDENFREDLKKVAQVASYF